MSSSLIFLLSSLFNTFSPSIHYTPADIYTQPGSFFFVCVCLYNVSDMHLFLVHSSWSTQGTDSNLSVGHHLQFPPSRGVCKVMTYCWLYPPFSYFRGCHMDQQIFGELLTFSHIDYSFPLSFLSSPNIHTGTYKWGQAHKWGFGKRVWTFALLQST